MTPRPALPVGTHGKISSRYVTPERAEAWARFRDFDGEVRVVTKTAPTKGAAEAALRETLRDRRRAGTAADITPNTTVSKLADAWLAAPHDWAANTVETYSYVVANQVKPALGGLRIAELRLAVINRALKAIRDRHGAGAAKTTKTALSGMCRLAIEHEALDENPVRDAIGVRQGRRTPPRALTVSEADGLCDGLRADQRATDLDLPDLVEFMLGTGMRIGEACTVGHRDCPSCDPHDSLDLDAGAVEVTGTLVRIKGHGLTVQHRTKSDAGWRVLALPPFTVDMIRRRRSELRFRAPHGVVFGSPYADRLRDPSNTAGDLREVLDRLGYDWVTSHTFRKTVATRMDEAGCTAREIADQLGHSKPSMTQDNYMGRNVVSAKAAKILDR